MTKVTKIIIEEKVIEVEFVSDWREMVAEDCFDKKGRLILKVRKD